MPLNTLLIGFIPLKKAAGSLMISEVLTKEKLHLFLKNTRKK